MDWVKTNHVRRALREGRPTAGSWLHLCSGIGATLLTQGAEELLGRFRKEVRS